MLTICCLYCNNASRLYLCIVSCSNYVPCCMSLSVYLLGTGQRDDTESSTYGRKIHPHHQVVSAYNHDINGSLELNHNVKRLH